MSQLTKLTLIFSLITSIIPGLLFVRSSDLDFSHVFVLILLWLGFCNALIHYIVDKNRVISSGGGELSMDFSIENSKDIDEDLHSRQLAVYGRDTMRRLFASNVLVSGLKGLGVEIGIEFQLFGVVCVDIV